MCILQSMLNTGDKKRNAKEAAWLQGSALTSILSVIKAGGGEARAVGGAVRNTLLGAPIGDVDLATNLPPEKTTKLLTNAGIKVVPTGIEHGTITAISDHKGFEITTLRRDVETDGRHATVAFTDDWQADAARRDFTFNALYMDADGTIFDYFRGREDLAAGHVRFIGGARERIKEDVLRILRFFRFHAWFGKGDANKEAVEACRELKTLIPDLSAERVWREMIKLLGAPNPLPAWALMQETGVLAIALEEASDLSRLENLLQVEKKYRAKVSPLVRLAALLPPDKQRVHEIAKRLKLSNRELEKLATLSELPTELKAKLDARSFRRSLYKYGPSDACDSALLVAAENTSVSLDAAFAERDRWNKPNFPIQGEDILKLGIPPGPKVGDILHRVEEWWATEDFKPTGEDCLAEAKRLAQMPS